MANKNSLSLDDLRAGTHVCSIFKYSIGQTLATIAFFTPALYSGIKCIYISGQADRNRLVEEFNKRGVDAKKYIKSGQLLLLDNKDAYLTGNAMNVESALESIKSMERQAVKEGYKSVRLAGELPLISGKTLDEDSIINYELTADKHIQSSGSTAMCHYDETKYSPGVLTKILASHPHVEIYGNLYNNNYSKDYSGKSYEDIIETIVTG